MISIIIPVYNAENYIEDCVNSILQQSFQDWELLLVENGSRDQSRKLCMQLAEKDGRIHVLCQEVNVGVSAARNLGLQKAKGEFITFIDADDWIEKEFLEVLWKLEQRTEADMVVCGYEQGFLEDRVRRRKLAEQKVSMEEQGEWERYREYTKEAYFTDCLLEGNTHCWGILYPKRIIEELTFPEGLSIGEDLLFLIDTALAAKKIVVTSYKGYWYFINQEGAMEKPFTPSYMDQITCWQLAADRLIKDYPRLKDKLDSILVVSVLLVAGKLSGLKREERNGYKKELKECRRLVWQYRRNGEAVKLLPSGYRLKSVLFAAMPGAYMKLYKIMRKRK